MASTSISVWSSMVHLMVHITLKVQQLSLEYKVWKTHSSSVYFHSGRNRKDLPPSLVECQHITSTHHIYLLQINSPTTIVTFTFPTIPIALHMGPMKCGHFSLSILGHFSSGISSKIAVDNIVTLAPVSTVYVRFRPSMCPFIYIPDTRGIPPLASLESSLVQFIW